MKISIYPLILLFIVISACSQKTLAPPHLHESELLEVRQGDKQLGHAELEQLIGPYTERMQAELQDTLCLLKVDLTRSSSGDSLFQKRLWNLVTDAVLAYAKSELNWNVNVALLNSGGLRRDLYAGPISVRDVYELLPFENFLVRIDLDEEGFQDMVNYLKAKNQPQSGLILGFKRDSLQRVELKTSASAHIVTINYLADGGDRMDFLSKGDREDSTILIRDAFMWYLKKNSILLPSFDNRTYEID